MPFKKGEGGRKKGSINKYTNLRTSFIDAFNKLGGTKGLVKCAKQSNLSQLEFYRLVAKMLPKDVNITLEGELSLAQKIKSARNRVKTTTQTTTTSEDLIEGKGSV